MGKLGEIVNLLGSRRVLMTVGASLIVVFAKDIFKVELTPEQAAEHMEKVMTIIGLLVGSLNVGLSIREHE